MSRKICLLLLIVIFGWASLPGIPGAAAALPLKKIGVLEIENATNFAQFGEQASDGITTDLLKIKLGEVTDRGRLAQVMAEHNLYLLGTADVATAARLGKAAGLDYLLMGSVFGGIQRTPGDYQKETNTKNQPWLESSARGDVTLTLRLVDVVSGKVVWSERADGRRLGEDYSFALRMAIYEAVRKLYDFIPPQGQVTKIDGDRIYIDLGLAANVAPGDIFTVQRTVPPAAGALPEKRLAARLQVVEAKDSYAIAVPAQDKDGKSELFAAVSVGDIATRQLRKKPQLLFGVWSGQHDY